MADNKKIASDVLAAVGGAANISDVAHCVTRLRFTLKDQNIPVDDEVKKIPGVLGVVRSGGQYQVIIGQNVTKVYDEVCSMGSFTAHAAINENLDAPKEKLTPKKIGSKIAERALAKGIEEVVFDRGGYIYHGRVKALAEAAREGGLKF